jgi:hypothetical protein
MANYNIKYLRSELHVHAVFLKTIKEMQAYSAGVVIFGAASTFPVPRAGDKCHHQLFFQSENTLK